MRKDTMEITDKPFTHVIFIDSRGTFIALPIADAQFFKTKEGVISVLNVAEDTTYVTPKIRMALAIEAGKFINGTFNPFQEREGA